MEASRVVEIRELTVARDGHRLLADVSLTVARGSTHFLVGRNGAGKSTLLAAVLGRVDFTGSIRLHWRASGRIGYVPQTFVVDPTVPVTVSELLALAHQRRPVCLGIDRRQRRRIDELLGRVGLAGFAHRTLHGLSGGELQRVLLANAIDPLPELLLLDEPASGLDVTAARRFEEILAELKRSGDTSVVMVSHDVSQVRRLADVVTIVDRGVRRSGRPDEVLAAEGPRALDHLLALEPS